MTTLVDAPARVDGVQLIGEMAGSGYRTPPSLVRRADGQVLQLTRLLYLVLKAVDGRRGYAELAEVVSHDLGRAVDEEQVRSLVDGHLRPLGLLLLADGTPPPLMRSNPLLRLKPRVAVTDPRTTRRLTAPFRVLFWPVVVVPVVLAFLGVVGWVFFERGLGASAYDAFQRPHLLVLVAVVTLFSAGFHEFGHAAAARYGGAQPGVMGLGLYLVWPAFYTDVTDSYRLDRAGRIRTDLGGLYFNAIVAVGTFVWWWASGSEALLLLVATQVLQMVQQLLPLLRFDGYHVLADISGVPDLYHRIKPTLAGLLPHHWRDPEQRALKPSARVVITAWVLITVPMMILMLLGVVGAVPRLLASSWSVIHDDVLAGSKAWGQGDAIDVAAHWLQVLGVLLPAMAGILVLARIGGRFFTGLVSWSRGSLGRRFVATVVSCAVATVLLWAWWPTPETYQPIRPGERGLVASLLPGQSPEQSAAGLARPPVTTGSTTPTGDAARRRLASDTPLVAAFDKAEPLPTKRHPALAMVLVPSRDGGGAGAADDGSSTEPWVFPFDRPLLPGAGDNQALAVNTTNGSVVYDVAFALVWAEGDQVLNVNEAHAYASCSDCVAVAVAFQVVMVVDDAHVIVPQNLAVAANYDCQRCITAALASQLVISLDHMPDDAQLTALSDIWAQLLQLAQHITEYSLADLDAQLEGFKQEIAAIVSTPPTSSDSTTQAPTTGTDPQASDAPTTTAPDGSTSTAPAPAPTGGPTPTSDPTPAGDPTPTSDPATTGSSPAADGTTADSTSPSPAG